MREWKLVLSSLVLAMSVGGTALAANSAAPANGTAQTTVHHTGAVKHKIVKHKKVEKKGAATSAPVIAH